jgi:hypothetical protein
MSRATRHAQEGVATLFTTVVLLFVMSVMAIYASRGSVLENTLMNNAYRAKQAAEVAEAALDFGLASYLAGGVDANADGAVDVFDPTPQLNGRRGTVRYCTEASTLTACTPLAVVGAGRALLVAEGWSDDQTAVHRAAVLITANPVFGGALKAPLIIKSAMNKVNGTFDLINNTDSGLNIWTGDDIDNANGNFQTRGKVNGVQNSLISKKSGSQFYLGPDVVYNDQSLKNSTSDGFYERVTGISKTDLIAQATIKPTADNPLISSNLYSGQIIFVNGDFKLDQNFGTADKPVILIVNGDLTGSKSNISLYGAILATSVSSFNGPRVFGSMIAENVGTLNGNSPIELNDQVVQGINNITRNSVVGNSWRDW